MGTRGAAGWRIQGEDYLTYNHYDSYPSALGLDVLAHTHIAVGRGIGALAEAIMRCEVVDEHEQPSEEARARLAERGITSPARVSTGDDWYAWLNEAQGNLDAYLNAGFLPINNDFVLDSLFCEWAYVVNLDEQRLEVYEGWQTTPGRGRYVETGHVRRSHDGTAYYPVTLVCWFPFDQLPGESRFLHTIDRHTLTEVSG